MLTGNLPRFLNEKQKSKKISNILKYIASYEKIKQMYLELVIQIDGIW